MIFSFPDLNFASFLGYTSQTIDVSPDDVFRLTSNQKVASFDQSECYLVELLNLDIQAYDGYKEMEKRKNILMVVPNVRQKQLSDVVYDANFPVWMSLNNANDSFIRNLECRILTDKYEKVYANTNGANIVLIIKDDDES